MKRILVLLIAAITLIAGGAWAGYPASSSYYGDQRATGHFWVSDPVYGGKCDGVTNDSVALAAADAAAAAVGGEVDFPASLCGIGVTAAPSPNARWIGHGARLGTGIRAIAAMTAALTVNISTGNNAVGPTPFQGSNFTVDANRPNCPNCSFYGVETFYDWLSTYDNLAVINSTSDLVHRATHLLPMNLSAITYSVGGGSPGSGVVLTTPDPSYQGNFPVFPNTPANLKIKVATTAALGTATLVLSQDGGATYATASQLIAGTTYLAQTSLANYNSWSSIVVSFPAGTYHAGDTYAFTAQQGDQYSIAAWTHWQNAMLRYGGTVYASNASDRATFASVMGFSSPGVQNDAYLAPGTITLIAGSNLVVGTGTTFVTGADHARVPRVGDFLFAKCGAPVNTNLYQIAGVLDDTHLFLPNGTTPPNCAASDYVISTGAGFFEVDSGDHNGGEFRQGEIQNVPTGVRLCGDGAGGMQFFGTHIESFYSAAGFSFGGIQTGGDTARVSVGIQAKGATVPSYGAQYYFQIGALETLIQPRLIGSDAFRGPGNLRVFNTGSDYTYSGSSFGGGAFNPAQYTITPIQAVLLPVTSIALTAGNQVIGSPTTDLTSNNTSYVELTPNAEYVGFSGTPELSLPLAVGQVMTIKNACGSGHHIEFFDLTTFSPSRLSASMQSFILNPCEEFTVRSQVQGGTTGKWVMVGEVGTVYEGPLSTNGSGNYRARPGYMKTTNATPQIMLFWDWTFSLLKGALISCDVVANDITNGTDFAEWDGVQIAIDGSGVFHGSKTIASARGSNAGAPPGTWTDPNYANASGQLNLNVTGVAAHTITWEAVCKQTSMSKF